MNLAQNYAKVLTEGTDVAKTIAYMKSKGHLSLLAQVVRILAHENANHDAEVVRVAREKDSPTAQKKFQGARVVIDPKIVGGYFARKGATLVDATYRKALITIYKNAIN